jgi:hypothetical protein
MLRRGWRGWCLVVLLAAAARPAGATGVPIDGYLPMAAITLTDEFVDDIDFSPYPSEGLGGSPVSSTGSAYFDIALLDTGAATSLITMTADAAFDLAGPYPGESDGFRGTEFIPIGGATGLIEARVSDPLGLYAAGLQMRTGAGAELAINAVGIHGQTNTSIATLPSESSLPNILGLSFASQYATRIRNSLPQIFDLNGQTVRSPAVDFLPLGSGNTHGISRKAPMNIEGASPSTPIYQLNFEGVLNGDDPWENPSAPTIVQGGHFLNVNASNEGVNLATQQFFFDTGASVTVLSELTALQLGIDVQLDEPDFTIEITGSGGGSGAVPGYYIDQFTILATGGSITHTNVPILVLDVTNPASPGNVVPGIVGTNVLAGRDIIIDPNPSLGGGGASAGVYISDPVTASASVVAPGNAMWDLSSAWSNAAVPDVMTIANVRRTEAGGAQITVASDAGAWEVNVAGLSNGKEMRLSVADGARLTTFAGLNIEPLGVVALDGGATLDVQYVDIRGGELRGTGSIATGGGPIPGQVENVSGVVAPGIGSATGLSIEGRFSNGAAGTLEIGILGSAPAQYGKLTIDGAATLDGTLSVLLPGASPYVPALGDDFTLIATTEGLGGLFSTVELPELPADRMWFLGYGDTDLVLKVTLGGDFNGDGTVAGDDLSVWEADNGALFNGSHFLAWQRNLGMSIPLPLSSVPEPAAAHIALLLAASLRLAGAARGGWPRRAVRTGGA